MLPFIVNDDPHRLVQITMTGSVGLGGRNHVADVKLVQALLNAVPADEGGPQVRLVEDGVNGPKTVSAIRRFQQRHTRVADGRIDVSGATIRTLARLLHKRDALPRGLPNLGPPDPRLARALNGNGYAAPSLRAVSTPRPAPVSRRGFQAAGERTGGEPLGPGIQYDPNTPFQPLNWKIVTSGGFDVSLGPLGLTIINLYMAEDSQPALPVKFQFSGLGAGLSIMPAGINLSSTDLPSWGTRLRRGLFGRNPCPKDDFGTLATIYSVGGTGAVGWNGSLILFGCYGPLLPSTRAVAALTGAQFGSPNLGITCYCGAIAPY